MAALVFVQVIVSTKCVYGCDDSDCTAVEDEASSASLKRTSELEGEIPEDNETASFLKEDSRGTALSRELSQSESESDTAVQLSSIDSNPVIKIFQWLD